MKHNRERVPKGLSDKAAEREGRKNRLFGSQELEPKIGKELITGLGMLIRPVLVYALPGQRITPTDVASHLYKHS